MSINSTSVKVSTTEVVEQQEAPQKEAVRELTGNQAEALGGVCVRGASEFWEDGLEPDWFCFTD